MFTVEGAAVRLLSAAAAKEVETVVGLCAPDVVYRVVSLDVYHGHEGIRTFLREEASVASIARHVTRAFSSGDLVCVERVDTLLLDHGTLDLPRVATMRFLDGLVVEWNDYQDFRDTARALGHDPRC